MKQIRSLRGSLTSNIKKCTFFVFGNLLDKIDNLALLKEIQDWKASEKTKNCYKMLFKEIEEGSEETYIARILKKIWPDEDSSEENVAYAIAVAQTILNPGYGKITIEENAVKKLAARHLVSI